MRMEQCDVLVVGSGASGMSAALTAQFHGMKVIVAEKAEKFGGTSARSGGWLWVPCTFKAKEWGIKDTPEAVKTYLKYEGGDAYNEERVDAFLSNGDAAIRFLEKNTEVKFDMPLALPDYHAEHPGGRIGGRTMGSIPFDGRLLGDNLKMVSPPLPELTVFGMMVGTGQDIKHFMRTFKSLASFKYTTLRFFKYFLEHLKYGRGMTLTNGNALIGRMLKSAYDLGVTMWASSPVEELLYENKRVVGAIVNKNGEKVKVIAKKGVIMAAGGFPHDVARRKKLFVHAPTGNEHWSPTPTTNTGDSFRMVEAVGVKQDTHLPNAAAWAPVSLIKRPDGTTGVMPHFIDRGKPGTIAVNKHGVRFTNEGHSYHDFVQGMINAHQPGEEIFSWLICDHTTLRNYGLGCVPPAPLGISKYLKNGYLKKGRSIAQLANAIGVSTQALEQTVKKFNSYTDGRDLEFGKGSTAYNRLQGDAFHTGPNPCVKPIEDGPYYAVKVQIGDLGTYAGIPVDRYCRALDEKGEAVKGLFAVGNDSTSIMGGNYPGGGSTLGPGVVFGYAASMFIKDEASIVKEAVKAAAV